MDYFLGQGGEMGYTIELINWEKNKLIGGTPMFPAVIKSIDQAFKVLKSSRASE